MGLFVQAESSEEKLLVSALCKRTDCDEAHCRGSAERSTNSRKDKTEKVDAPLSKLGQEHVTLPSVL